MHLEVTRMIAFCHEQAGRIDDAWKQYWAAIEVAEGMEPDKRSNSSFLFVGEGLLRLCRAAPSTIENPNEPPPYRYEEPQEWKAGGGFDQNQREKRRHG